MDKEKRRRLTGLILTFLVISICFTSPVRSFFSIPVQQRLTVGDPFQIKLDGPSQILKNLSIYIENEKNDLFQVDGKMLSQTVLGTGNRVIATHPGKANVQLRLFGLIPLKTFSVEVLPKLRVIPGGHSVGIILHSQGALVVGQSIVEDEKGNKSNPAKEAGIQVGDVILSINDKKVESDEQVSKIINEAGNQGRKLRMVVKHKELQSIKTITPVMCRDTKRYRIGLYIRDSAAGVGTLTFYDPVTNKYGALGHVITDADTNQPISISDGNIVKSLVQGIEKGKRGQPGEKVGMFVEERKHLGKIEKNTNFGIFGSLKQKVSNPLFNVALPVALASQVKEGPAQILTVIEGDKIEKFSIEIQKIQRQLRPDTKGLVLKVTDERLLNKTGGIVQGMSGSPIIQNGKIVGAVTHVFVNDPTKGYGVLIEWMLRETGVIKDKTQAVGLKEDIPPFFLCFYLCQC